MSTLSEDVKRMQQFIQPLNVNGLKGRLLKIAASDANQKKELLMIYGHHSSLERMFGVAEAFSDFGSVTMPDLPGFGGMDSFYSIGMKPTVDDLADYLATFVKLRYRSKKVTIIGMSFGFVVATRMLQRYPELIKKVDVLVSLVGFAHKNDFAFSAPRRLLYKTLSYTFSKRATAWFFYHFVLQPYVIKTLYAKTHNAKAKFASLSKEEVAYMLNFETVLWRINDVRTHAYTNYKMFHLDNCTVQVDLPVHHVTASKDQYFDRTVVEQHMRIIFNDYHESIVASEAHAPSIMANKSDAQMLIPDTLRAVLRTGGGAHNGSL